MSLLLLLLLLGFFFINANPVFDFISCQSFGIAEGKRVQDLRDMAKAAGQSMPGFTPPEGETQEQVMFKSLSTTIFRFCLFWFWVVFFVFYIVCSIYSHILCCNYITLNTTIVMSKRAPHTLTNIFLSGKKNIFN